MSSSSSRPILSDVDRVRILDELDQSDITRGSNRRKWPRLEYRLRGVPVKIEHHNGSTVTVLVPTRNISCGGVSLLMTCFLHTGTRITVGLPDLKGGHKACAGHVAFCRFICGRIHEVGVSFTEVIDTNDFCVLTPEATGLGEGCNSETRAPLAGSVIVLSARSAERVLAVARLRQTGMDAVGVETPGSMLDRVKRIGAAAVVLDTDIDPDQMDAAMGALSELCPTLPVLGLVYPADPAKVAAALGSGLAGCLSAPLAVADVHEAMGVALKMGSPFVPPEGLNDGDTGEGGGDSDPHMVRYFVSHCAECAGRLQAASATQDLLDAQAVCKGLQATAPGYGFRSVAFAAKEALAELNATGSVEESTVKLVALLNVLNRLACGFPSEATAVRPAAEAAGTKPTA